MIAPWAFGYVGIPFRDDGLTRDGLHCWGLVRLVFAEQLKIDLPSYGEDSAADLLAAARHFRTGAGTNTWPAVDNEYRPFDGVMMTAMLDQSGSGRMHRIPAHCGVMCSPRHVLHIWSETSAVIMPLDHPRIRSKLIGVYRHKDMA